MKQRIAFINLPLQAVFLVIPSDPHPVPPTRYAQMDYMKSHPPRGCKSK